MSGIDDPWEDEFTLNALRDHFAPTTHARPSLGQHGSVPHTLHWSNLAELGSSAVGIRALAIRTTKVGSLHRVVMAQCPFGNVEKATQRCEVTCGSTGPHPSNLARNAAAACCCADTRC